ncbi:cupin 2, conserved barrel domain protein [Teredinibacter turnerae T7901]|uniref:Cupin 2, conserved barrel domain protein n=1 Tax=Teredinibacter turnerae (strain ATCC 39867 / T7901) TaxID=377629 RepID=C5BT15_TERTT|nr:cupin domain-containing protein [Teredinibacter turnerae]ACR14432.1 cupin 2, conserved barrel domain protein [Teredinibacter turnerae T7901]
MNESPESVPNIVRNAASLARKAPLVSHPLNGAAQRKTVSLGDLTRLSKVGIHLNVVAPGVTTTEPHRHEFADEFMFILQGTAEVQLGDEIHTLTSGDFIGLPARGPAHAFTNTGGTELIYLVGGNRPDFDVCTYPNREQRLYVYQSVEGRVKDWVRKGTLENDNAE